MSNQRLAEYLTATATMYEQHAARTLQLLETDWSDNISGNNFEARVSGGEDHSDPTQAKAIAVTAGQFFSSVQCSLTSGIATSVYRDGDGTAIKELEDLLRMGTTNKRRMKSMPSPLPPA